MVEFKAVINDVKTGKSYQVPVTGHHANSLIGKKVGDVVDGIFVGLPGYKLAITGGSDKDGFPMRRDLPGVKRRRILLTRGIGFQSMEPGLRMRMSIRGNAVSPEVSQLNLKITQFGSKSVDELIKVEEKKK